MTEQLGSRPGPGDLRRRNILVCPNLGEGGVFIDARRNPEYFIAVVIFDVDDIQRGLADYLGTHVAYCHLLASGWETTVFEFRVEASSPCRRDLPVGRPLVLRCYQGVRAAAKGSREAAIMGLLARNNYPLPRPYLFEDDVEPLGGPFLIMERVEGRPLFSVGGFPRAFKTFSLGFVGFVRAQVHLHSLGSDGHIPISNVPQAYTTADAPGDLPLLERLFRIIARRIEEGPLPGLRDALASLRRRAPRYSPAPPTIVHMDYHPQNVMVSGFRVSGVLDWVNADVGDRHLCAATTAVILSSSAMEQPRWMRDNAAGNTLRALFAFLYLPLYHASAPMELERFRFAQGVAALLRLSMFGMMRTRGPESVGFRPEAIENVTPSVLRLLSRYASRKAGVPATI
jgi:aminoglycoside phosphotransferase (APT) family kinase protein